MAYTDNPKQSDHQPDPHYLEHVEEELNDVCMWASLKKQISIITSDLKLDRQKPERAEKGKYLRPRRSEWNAMFNHRADEDYADIRDTAGRYFNQQIQPF